MYVKKQIVKQVIELFSEDASYRDDRWETIRAVTNTLRKDFPELDEFGIIQLAFDVDRAFRYIQQHIPSLRGESWLERQRMSGEISREEYDKESEHIDFIRELSLEKHLPFQTRLFE